MIEYPRLPGMPESHLPFSPCTKVGNLLFVSGQASVDESGNIVQDDFEGEMLRSIGNLRQILQACGSDLDHVVQTRNYVRDAADLPEFNRIYAESFREPFPARTTITNCLPDVIRYEIECVAFVPSD